MMKLFLRSQGDLFGGGPPKPRREVKSPGSRGAVFYFDKEGHVRYGVPPTNVPRLSYRQEANLRERGVLPPEVEGSRTPVPVRRDNSRAGGGVPGASMKGQGRERYYDLTPQQRSEVLPRIVERLNYGTHDEREFSRGYLDALRDNPGPGA